MPNQPFVGALYTYPWDLMDEGLDSALSRIIDLTGCLELLLTPCYHRSTYFLPHNPRRPIYFGENGAIYFSPDLSRYANTRIRPHVSKEVTDAAYFDRIVEAIEKRGLTFSAWMVYTFQDYLSEQYPEFAKHDAFGNPYVGELSTVPLDVQEYFLALTTEVIERYKPAAVWVESLMRRGFCAPSKRRAGLSPRCQFLLSLCFNPVSAANANAGGMDGERFQQQVVDWLRPRLARLPTEEDEAPVTEVWIAEAFSGQLKQYLEISRRHTTALWLKVAEVIHQGGAKVQANLADATTARRNDLNPVINKSIDRLSFTLTETGEKTSEQVKDLIRRIAPGGEVFIPIGGGRLTESGALAEQLKAVADAGAAGATFYNYGLLREEQLGFIGTALRSLMSFK